MSCTTNSFSGLAATRSYYMKYATLPFNRHVNSPGIRYKTNTHLSF
jgi:hypothetical protein